MIDALALALLLQASSAQNATPAAEGQVAAMDDPEVTHRPSGEEIALAYPIAGYHAERDGLVTVSCVIADDGSFKTCKILSEAPKRLNFGWAALAVAFKYRVATRMRDGQTSEGHEVTIPIHFIYDDYAHNKALAWKKLRKP